MLVNNLKYLLKEYETVVFFDTETTGLNAQQDCIIELACIKLSNTGEIDYFDYFIQPFDHRPIPQEITDLTGISNSDIYKNNEAVSEEQAIAKFMSYLQDGKTLLVAHNAQFDLNFTKSLLKRHYDQNNLNIFNKADYLDTVTVYKDRAEYPHKLVNAIEHYGLQDVVKNSHRAIDDVKALMVVTDRMIEERKDLLDYINVFGFNTKYGLNGFKLNKVKYKGQTFSKTIKSPSKILPRLV